ncbi:MAG: phosphoribosylanthranilate isomerase [Ignavibacteriaceae bacterium]|nr:phosphoribosylanthranilate isomerase [Ignavibacteriaceae bacterium]
MQIKLLFFVTSKKEAIIFIRVKICCISSIEEAKLAIKYGASALGLVSEMPSGPGVIDDELITEIVSKVPPPIATFLLTSKQNADDILLQHSKTLTNTLQLVDHLPQSELIKLKKKLPEVKLVQVIHVIDEESVSEALNVEKFVDALLLDSGNPKLKVKELGGTGRTHNWEISRSIIESVNIPVFLAGGLNIENVDNAINTVQPFGLDLCSGVRTNGLLDEEKLKAFMKKVQDFNLKNSE